MITIELKGYKEALEYFTNLKPGIHKMAGRTINEAVDAGKSFASKLIRDEYKIQKRDVDRAFRVYEKARASKLKAVLTISSRPISLIYFGASQFQTIRGTVFKTSGRSWEERKRMKKGQVGVSVEVRRGKRKELPKTFIGYNRRGEPQVYLRGKDKKLAPLHVNTIPTFLQRQGRLDKTIVHIDDVLTRRFNHHLDRLIKGETS